MPPVVAAVLVGAGVFAGVKWISRKMARVAQAARLAREELSRDQRVATVPKDLGTLEWDAAAGVYRPRARRES